jgi:esterase/lipase superfamily enzyme
MQSNSPLNYSAGSQLGWMIEQYRRMQAYLGMMEQQSGLDQQIIRAAISKNTELIQMLAAYQARDFSRCR